MLLESDRKDLAIQALARSATISDLSVLHSVSCKFVYQGDPSWSLPVLYAATRQARAVRRHAKRAEFGVPRWCCSRCRE